MISIRPWKLPLIVAAIVVPVASGFLLGGPGIGIGVGGLAALAIVLAGVRRRPRQLLLSAPADDRAYLLVVVACIPDEEAAVERISTANTLREEPEETVVQVLAPVQTGFLDRWASAVDPAREEAQRKLVTMTAALAKAGIAAAAKVGDEDVVQAVEDEMVTFPATELMLITGEERPDRAGEISTELRSRSLARFRHVVVPARFQGRGHGYEAE